MTRLCSHANCSDKLTSDSYSDFTNKIQGLKLSALLPSSNSTWLVTSRLDMTRHVRRVEPVHFGRVELVEQHGSTGSTRRARHGSTRRACRVVSRRDVTSQVEFGLTLILSSVFECIHYSESDNF